MAITDSLGYGGTVTENDIPLWARSFGGVYGVVGVADWKVTLKTGVPLTVAIAAGEGFGHRVIDTNDDEVTKTFTTLTSGTRYDLVVAHRDWSGAGGTTTFEVIAGTSTQLGVFGSREQNPGVEDDQPIALVQIVGSVGGGSVGTIYDLRVWNANGGMVARDELALQYLTEPGTTLQIGDYLWTRSIDASGSAVWAWVSLKSPLNMLSIGSPIAGTTGTRPAYSMQMGTLVQASDATGFARITFPTAFPNGLMFALATPGDDSAGAGLMMPVSGGSFGIGTRTDFVYRLRNTSGILTGYNHRVNWFAVGF